MSFELLNKTDRYQNDGSPHNYVKAQRHGNDLGRDTTEVTVMPEREYSTKSGDTDEGHTRLIGSEDEKGSAWCMECWDYARRHPEEDPPQFVDDLYVFTTRGTARRKCVRCRRPIGEVFA